MVRPEHGWRLAISGATACLAVLLVAGCGGPAQEASTSPSAEDGPVTAQRSAVASAGASPEEVARAYVLAMSEDRPDHANALWGGPVKMLDGFDAWRDHANLVIEDSKPSSDLPVPDGVPDEASDSGERFLKGYSELATVRGRMNLVRGDDSLFEPGTLRFGMDLGKATDDAQWYVLGIHFDQ